MNVCGVCVNKKHIKHLVIIDDISGLGLNIYINHPLAI